MGASAKFLELATDIEKFALFKTLQSLPTEIEVVIVTSKPVGSPWVVSVRTFLMVCSAAITLIRGGTSKAGIFAKAISVADLSAGFAKAPGEGRSL